MQRRGELHQASPEVKEGTVPSAPWHHRRQLLCRSASSSVPPPHWELVSGRGAPQQGPNTRDQIQMPPTSGCGLSNAVVLWNSPIFCLVYRQPSVNQNHQVPLPETPLSTHYLADGQHSGYADLAELNWIQSWLGRAWLYLAPCLKGKRKNDKRKKRKQILVDLLIRASLFQIQYLISSSQSPWEHHISTPALRAWTWEKGMLSLGLRSRSWFMAEGSFEPRTV